MVTDAINPNIPEASERSWQTWYIKQVPGESHKQTIRRKLVAQKDKQL